MTEALTLKRQKERMSLGKPPAFMSLSWISNYENKRNRISTPNLISTIILLYKKRRMKAEIGRILESFDRSQFSVKKAFIPSL